MKNLKVIICTGLASLVALFGLFPFYIMFMAGTYPTSDIYTKIPLLPGSAVLENLAKVLRPEMLGFYFNSLYIAVVTSVLCILASAMAGFALAKYRFRFRKQILGFVLATIMIPAQIGLVGYIVEMRFLGLNNTHLPLIFSLTASSFGVFWFHQYIGTNVPKDVLESARIDGCNDYGIFFLIALPFIRPAIITFSTIIFMASWNNYLLPLIILNKQSLFTLPVGITTLGTMYGNDLAGMIMGLALGTVPSILIFSFGSRYFVRGIMQGAVKG